MTAFGIDKYNSSKESTFGCVVACLINNRNLGMLEEQVPITDKKYPSRTIHDPAHFSNHKTRSAFLVTIA